MMSNDLLDVFEDDDSFIDRNLGDERPDEGRLSTSSGATHQDIAPLANESGEIIGTRALGLEILESEAVVAKESVGDTGSLHGDR